MVKRDLITKYIYEIMGKELLDKAAKVDVMPNSVQIHGSEEVHKVVLGVSASLEFLEQAVANKAQYCIFHHGMSFEGLVVAGRLNPVEERLRVIFKHDLTLAGFHYYLDAHPEIGNNALIIKALGAKLTEETYFDGWGWIGELDQPVEIKALADKCAQIFNHEVYTVNAGKDKVKRLGVCSGGAMPKGKEFLEIIDKQVDVHLTGVITESGPHLAEEGGYNYLAAGHYATEVFGIKALAEKIKAKFGKEIEVEFIDIPSSL